MRAPLRWTALGLLVACTGAAPEDGMDEIGDEEMPDGEQPDLTMLVTDGYGGFDGVHTYAVPLATSLAGPIRWEVRSGQGSVIARPAPAGSDDSAFREWALFTAGGAGAVEVVAIGSNGMGTTRIAVTAYTEADYAIGARRYNDPAGPQTSCASCHARPEGHDHSPLNTMFWPDAELLRAITTGAYTDDTSLTIEHRWEVKPEEQRGLLAYLRAMPPRGF